MPVIREREGDEDRDQDRDRQQQTTSEEVELEQESETREEPEVEVVEASNEEEGDEEGGDERIAQSDEQEEQHTRRRETAAERRQRAKDAKRRDKMELDFQKRELDRLQKTVWDLTQGQIVTRVTELDNRISSAQAEVAQWEKVKAAAISKHEGADAVAADNFLNEARTRLNQAGWDRQELVKQAQSAPREAPSREAPFEGYKREFMSNNPWYHQDGVDEDSLIVKAIDHAVAQEYKATDPRYWEELQKRVNARIGKTRKQQSRNDDSNDEDDVEDEPVRETRQTTRRGGPPVGGSSRSNSSGGSGGTQQIKLSPLRVQAMKDAGLWDDPKVRQRMAKKYSEYDRQNRNG